MPVPQVEEVNEASWKCSGTVGHVKRLFILPTFIILYAFLGINTLYTHSDYKLPKWKKMKQLSFTARALSIMLALLSRETVQPLRAQQRAVEPPKLIELVDEGSAVRPSANSAVVDILLDARPTVHEDRV